MELVAEGLIKKYGLKLAVNDFNFYIKSGEIVSFLGANGAGKTTSFYLLIGIILPDQGKIILNGEDITRYPMHVRSKMGLGYLPQENSIFKQLSVEDNILVFLESLNLTKKEMKYRLDEVIESMNIERLRKVSGVSLSGGERRRVEVARCLALKPRCLFFDEPFAGVDPLSIQEIHNIMRILADSGISVIICDHNVREAIDISSRSYIMHNGKIIAEGTVNEVLHNEEAKKYYFGNRFKQENNHDNHENSYAAEENT